MVRLIVLLALLVAFVAPAVTRSLPWQAPYRGPVASDFPPNTLLVNFGIQRVTQTRSILVSTGTSPASAPTSLTARLSADLIEGAKLQQFPADQVTLTATPLLAFLLLLLGAIFGLSVKWVTEALSSLAAARWRFEAIVHPWSRRWDLCVHSARTSGTYEKK